MEGRHNGSGREILLARGDVDLAEEVNLLTQCCQLTTDSSRGRQLTMGS